MYNSNQFKEEDISVVMDFIKQNPFAILCGCDAGNKPVATHIPFLVEEREGQLFLLGHIMRKTDHHKAFEQNPEALVIFNGPHSYISASWYTNPQTASTWNYITVHARGAGRFTDETALLDILTRTTALFENNPDSPALVEKMPEAYVSSLSKAIVGFEIAVTQLDNLFKLSQNRDAASYKNIIGRLREQGTADAGRIADEMEKRTQSKK
ncbi:MAG: FMN-binding negative transcriptional regulator [Agriterribacter sp.]